MRINAVLPFLPPLRNISPIKIPFKGRDGLQADSFQCSSQSLTGGCMRESLTDSFEKSAGTNQELNFSVETTEIPCFREPAKYIEKYANSEFIAKAIKENPKIAKKLAQTGISNITIEPQNVTGIIDSHLIPTMQYMVAILEHDGYSVDEGVIEAALLHDIGKALIPSSLLNTKEKITSDERKMINSHSDAGYEILKTAHDKEKVGLTDVSFLMVKNHHNHNLEKISPFTKALMTADVYSALLEKRPYRMGVQSYTPLEAIGIMKDDVNKGLLPMHEVMVLAELVEKKNN